MTKYIYRALLAALIIPAFLLTSCKKDDGETGGLTHFEFTETEVVMEKSEGSAEIEVTWERTASRAATLEFYISTEGLSNPAVEGTDYNLSAKSIDFGTGEKKKSLTVTALSPGTAGDKSFRIVMKSSTAADVMLGKASAGTNICTVTLKK